MATSLEEAKRLKELYNALKKSKTELRDLEDDLNKKIEKGNISQSEKYASLSREILLLKDKRQYYTEEATRLDKLAKKEDARDAAKAASLRAEAEQYRKIQAELAGITNANAEQLAFLEKISGALRTYGSEWDKILRTEKKVSDDIKKIYKDGRHDQALYYKSGKKGFDLTLKSIGDIATQSANAFGDALGEVTNFFNQGDMLLMASGIFGKGGLSLVATIENLKKAPTDMDTQFRDIVKKTGLFVEGMKNTFVDIIDPAQAEAFTKNLPEQPLLDVGINAKDSAAALKSLVEGASLFRPAYMEANRGVTAFVGNTIAGLSKMGVATDVSTKSIDFFTRAFKQTPIIATQSTKRLVTMADTLGINVGQAMKDFNENMKNLSQYGDRAITVFANLEAQAVATGIKVGDLAQMAGKLDTFKGAAEAGQRLNAVLGGTFLSITDLVHADPAQKFEMIKKAVSDAGLSFDTMNRRMRTVVATAAGVGTVENLARLLGSEGDFEMAKKGMETAAMGQEDFKKRVESTMTRAELLNKGMGRLAGGFQKWVDRTRKTAVRGSNIMINAFSKILGKTKDSEKAMIGFMMSFSAIKAAAGKIRTIAGGRAKVAMGAMGVAIVAGDLIGKAPAVPGAPPRRSARATPVRPAAPGAGHGTPLAGAKEDAERIRIAANTFKSAAEKFESAQKTPRDIEFTVVGMSTAEAKKLENALNRAMS